MYRARKLDVFNTVRKCKEQPNRDGLQQLSEKYTRRNQQQTKYTEEWVSELEDRVEEISDAEQKKKKVHFETFGIISSIAIYAI